MSPPRKPCADLQLGLWISAKSVGNINSQVATKKAESNLLADVWVIHLLLDPKMFNRKIVDIIPSWHSDDINKNTIRASWNF